MLNIWNQTLSVQQGSGAALTNTTTATSLLLGQAKFPLAAQFIQFIGQKLRVKASGKISTAASTPGTFTFDIRFGSIVIFTGGASPTLATSAANVTWRLEVDLVMATVGSGTTATMTGDGVLWSLANTGGIQLLPATSPAPGTGFDSTITNTVDMFGTWSAASASNTVTCTGFELLSVV